MSEDKEDFELVPLRQIEELREELMRLKETPFPSPKRLEISLDEVTSKMNKLIAIFEEASHQIKINEGDLGFRSQFSDLSKKLDEVLDQNQEIAKGIVALADMVTEIKDKKPSFQQSTSGINQSQKLGMQRGGLPPPLFPAAQGGIIPPPPMPPIKKKGLFK